MSRPSATSITSRSCCGLSFEPRWPSCAAGQADLLRTLLFGMVASNATLVGLVLAAVKLG
jgi:hypothetical protein